MISFSKNLRTTQKLSNQSNRSTRSSDRTIDRIDRRPPCFGGWSIHVTTIRAWRLSRTPPKYTAAGDRFDRSRGRSIESIDSIDSIIFRSFAKFLKNRSRRDDRFRQKIVKIRAILAIFRPFEDFGDFRFDRFDIFFDSIDTEPNDRWGPPCLIIIPAVRVIRAPLGTPN